MDHVKELPTNKTKRFWTYDSNGPIQFYEYEDRIEIRNHGNLYGKANAENFPHVNDYRNIVIAESLRVLGFINRFSRGVQRVEDDLVANGNGMPEFDLSLGTAFKVIEQKAHIEETNNETIKSSHKFFELSENHRKLLHLLSLHPKWQYTDFQFAINLSRVQVGRILKELKENGYINRIGSKKTGEWQVRKPLSKK